MSGNLELRRAGLLPEEAEPFDSLDDLLDRFFRVVGSLSAGDDDLSAPEEQNHHFWLVHPVHESGELLRLVFDVLQSETDCEGVEIEIVSEVGARHDVLNGDLRILFDGDL